MTTGPAERAHSISPPAYRGELVVSLHEVSRYFTSPQFVRALTHASFEVRRGEVFGLLGPAGSGKSTALRILAGRLSPSDGKARVFGRPPRRPAARKRVGYLPGKPSQSQPHLFTRGLRFLGRLFPHPKLSPHSEPAEALPSNKRLLLVKQLLLKNPELLLLDEPFAGLDATGCLEMSQLIADAAQGGKAVILTSDSLACAKDVCERVAVLYASRIEAIGTLEEILALPDAIRFTGPVLPRETVQRVLGAIGEDLAQAGSVDQASALTARSSSRNTASGAATERATPTTTTNELLASLVGGGSTLASSEVPEQIVPPVDHDRLAALTQTNPRPTPDELNKAP
jgi:ABC-2 type transport system ATP-binding protein